MAVAGSSLPVAFSRRRRPKHLVIGGLLAIAGSAALAGALAQSRGDLKLNEASTVVIRARAANGTETVGSGMTLSPTGQVLTVDTLVETASTISVAVPGRQDVFGASIVGLDPRDDVAVLQLQHAAALPVARAGDPSHLTAGDHVVAVAAHVGGAIEMESSVVGVSAATPQDVESAPARVGTMTIDAAARTLDGGDIVVDGDGRVVGMIVNGAALAQSAGSHSMAIAIDRAAAIARDIVTGRPNPNVLRGNGAVLGVEVRDSSDPVGARVIATAGASPAQAAGIIPGDVIVQIGSHRVTSAVDVPDSLRGRGVGDQVLVRWLTAQGRTVTVTVAIAGGTAR